MPFLSPNKPALITVIMITLLVGLMYSFTYQPTAVWLQNKGLEFVRLDQFSLWPKNTTTHAHIRKNRTKTFSAAAKKLDKASRKTIDTLKQKVNFLENFVQGNKTCLDEFFGSLPQCAESSIHIWYYGDSQIEGDRLTGELRRFFQGKFGGQGTGYVPFADVASYQNFKLIPSNSMVKLNCFVNKAPKGYGFAGKTFKFSPTDSSKYCGEGIQIQPWLRYNKLFLLTGKHPGGLLKVKGPDTLVQQVNIPASEVSQRVLISNNGTRGKWQFELPEDGQYSGFSFESNQGIHLDNCGIRGHSGDGLRFISSSVISSEAKTWNTKLVVFHFGNNMIPVIKGDKASMEYYTRYFVSIFKRYKVLIPDASILVISAGDMGTVVDGEEVGYPHLSEFTEAMRNAAIQSGAAFFDAHSMIQKDGGILGWKRKGYCSLDGHLSNAGQMKFAATIFAEIMREFEIYKIINTTP